MGAAFAGVFWGVLVTAALDFGISITAMVVVVVVYEAQKLSVAGQKGLTERRWSPSSCCGLVQTSWQCSEVDLGC